MPLDALILDLRDNQLSDLIGQIPVLPGLKELDLSCNHVKQLGRGTIFAHLEELRSLNLSRNDFRTVFNGVYRGLHRLQTLSMEHGQLRFIEEHAFDGLSQLRSLQLGGNQLSALFPEWFSQLHSLTHLALHDNQVGRVGAGAFEPLVALRSLRLDANGLRGVSDRAFAGLANLTDLHLHHNLLAKVPSAALRSAVSLQTLTLGGNLFTHLRTGDFVRLPSLREVSLEGSQELEAVEGGAFWDLPALQTVSMQESPRLRFLARDALRNTPALQLVQLQRCALSALAPLQGYAPGLQVNLQGNPLLCDCNVRWLQRALTEENEDSVEVVGGAELRCDRPPPLRGRPLRALTRPLPDRCPPTVVGPADDVIHATVGEELVLECLAHGLPEPSVRWELPMGGTSPSATLRISRLTPREAGVYECEASSAEGTARRRVSVRVRGLDIRLWARAPLPRAAVLVWNGTARNAFPEYRIVYRPAADAARPYQAVTVSQFLRSYTVHHLLPDTAYDFCLGVNASDSAHQPPFLRLACARVTTLADDGVGNLARAGPIVSGGAVAATAAVIAGMGAVLCSALAVARHRRRHRPYDTPEKALVPLDALQRPLVIGAR